MWICNDCGAVFDEPEDYYEHDTGYHEIDCPHCGSDDIDEAKRCAECDEWANEKNLVNGLTLSGKNCVNYVSLGVNSLNCSVVAVVRVKNCINSVSVYSSGESDSVCLIESNDGSIVIIVVEVSVNLGVEVSSDLNDSVDDKLGCSIPVLNYDVSNVSSSLSSSKKKA